MDSFINDILACICMDRKADQYNALEEQPPLDFTHEKKQTKQTTDSKAADILSTLYAADTNDELRRLEDIVQVTDWYADLAAAVLTGLQNAIKAEVPMGQALK